jgi:hypothetical protein
VGFTRVTAPRLIFWWVSGTQIVIDDCDFHSATFQNTEFYASRVQRTNLQRADLSYTLFSRSRLEAVALNDASLENAIFVLTELRDVRFNSSTFSNTVLASCTISESKGLESIHHRDRSSVDTHTLFNTHFPSSFLRGIGLPDTFITYLDSLKNNPIEYYSCFLSYSSKDDDFARRLYNDLQARDIRTWFAPEDLKIGDRFRVRIDESIRIHDKLVVILSGNSVASDWVESEVEAALERERRDKRSVLFPIAIDEAGFSSDEPWAADIRRKRHIGDFRNWKSHDDYTSACERLVRDLKKG